MERFQKEGGLDLFDDRDAMELFLDVTRCPGDKKSLTDILIDEFGSVKAVLEAREEQLTRISGIGVRTAAAIKLVMSFMRIWERSAMTQGQHIGNSHEAEQYCKSLLIGQRHEQFYVICLNAQCNILGQRKISDGSLSEVNSYPRVIMETALNYNAHSVILCHNHPGGTLHPSFEDIRSTKIIQKLLQGVGIMVLDHIIVSGDEAYSMIQHGDIDYCLK